MDQKELERQRDEESRRKLNEHLAKIRKLGRMPTPGDDAAEEHNFQQDWARWKEQYRGRVLNLRASPVDPDADYKLLGIARGASEKDIRRAFYKLAKTAHPDQGGNAERFHALMAAYQRLTSGK